MEKYYDGTKLLSMMDINGNRPEIYICTSNRTAGKTTYYSRLLVNKFLQNGEKFCLLYRYSYELDNIADKFFKDIQSLFFPNHELKSKKMAKGLFCELYLDDELCGYAISLNNPDNLKKYSHIFNDVNRILFDEFQSESNKYCPQEINKFISVHTTIARGHGKQNRRVPVYMLSNMVSILNPYYTELGIAERLNKDTKFLKGEGFVLEQNYNESASKAQQLSAFNRAFSTSKYLAYSSQNIYLNDNQSFVESIKGIFRYICTIKYCGETYSLKEYSEKGIIYCDTSFDNSFPTKITVTTEDHNINYVMLTRQDFFISNLRTLFEKGCFRFKNLKAKEACLKMLSY